MKDTIVKIAFPDKEITLLGTAHISSESVSEVQLLIQQLQPDHICVEIDAERYKSITKKKSWENMDIVKIIKDGKGFLLLANLTLASFQRRLGEKLSIAPGAEMLAAIDEAGRLEIPFSFCDREVQITLRRAWAKSSFWNRSKLLAALASSVFNKEEITSEQIEALKTKSALDEIMVELANSLPTVKEVLIDERDRYLATKIFLTEGKNILAVLGAGHLEGVRKFLLALQNKELSTDLADIMSLPKKSRLVKVLPFVIPLILIGLVFFGFVRSGSSLGVSLFLQWLIIHGIASAIGALLAFGNPLTILASFIGSPVVILKPFVNIGMVAAYVQIIIKKPQVLDFENLHNDIMSIKGFYKNKITRTLLVFLLSSLGGVAGNIISIATIGSKLL